MKYVKYLFFSLIVIALLFTGIGFLLPASWTASRSVIIKSPPEAIHAYIENLRKWPEWSPWTQEKDPQLQYIYEGPDTGVGAQQNWTSSKMGKGWLRLVESDPKRGVKFDLFIDMEGSQSNVSGRISYETAGDQTKVTWTDQGNAGGNPYKRWMNILIVAMLEKDMDVGLAKLKALTESGR